MIVDDSADELALIKRTLLKTGWIQKVRTAERGETALDLLGRYEVLPALVFLDLKMPGMGGIETVRRIRATEKTKHIPVIILTTSSLETDKQAAYEAGADFFLHKAINLDQFTADVTSLLKFWLTA